MHGADVTSREDGAPAAEKPSLRRGRWLGAKAAKLALVVAGAMCAGRPQPAMSTTRLIRGTTACR